MALSAFALSPLLYFAAMYSAVCKLVVQFVWVVNKDVIRCGVCSKDVFISCSPLRVMIPPKHIPHKQPLPKRKALNELKRATYLKKIRCFIPILSGNDL